MKDKEVIRNISDQNRLRRNIQMRYETPEKNIEISEDIVKKTNRGMQIKKMLINYYMNTMNTRKTQIDDSQKICEFCNTTETSLWRRIGEILVCNACGLYYRIHGKLRNKVIMKGKKIQELISQDKKEETENETKEEISN